MFTREEAIDVLYEAGVIAFLRSIEQGVGLGVHQAAAQIATRVQPEAPTASAKGVGDRLDPARHDFDAPEEHAEPARRSGAASRGLKGAIQAQPFAHLAGRDELPRGEHGGGPGSHQLDEPDLEASPRGERKERRDVLLERAAPQHRVHLNGRETRGAGGVDSRDDAFDRPPPASTPGI